MAPAYKLTYFPIDALAEPIRFLMNYGGIEFIDDRLDRTKWPTLKLEMPFGRVPVLEYNGKKFHQNVAIARFFAKQVKLVGANDWEDLEIDAVVDTITDFRSKIWDYHYADDKEAKKEPLFNEHIPYYLKRFENMVKDNNGYLAVKKLTWADLYFVAILNTCTYMTETDIIANYPNLVGLKNTVLEIPSIKEWMKKRPKNNYKPPPSEAVAPLVIN